jgi:cytochrome c7-like protein
LRKSIVIIGLSLRWAHPLNLRQAGTSVWSWLRAAPRRRVALAIGLPLFFVVILLGIPLRTPPVAQPVAFDHRKHTQDLKLDCQFCHQYVTAGAHAGLPDGRVCVMCHQVRLGTSAEAARVTALLAGGDPLRFNKLFRLPPHVNFTHRRHVGIAKLPCQDCHGAIAQSERPPARPLVTIRMGVCLSCHQATGQPTDCVACHR